MSKRSFFVPSCTFMQVCTICGYCNKMSYVYITTHFYIKRLHYKKVYYTPMCVERRGQGLNDTQEPVKKNVKMLHDNTNKAHTNSHAPSNVT